MQPNRLLSLYRSIHIGLAALLVASLLTVGLAFPALADDAGYALQFDGTTDNVILNETLSIMGAGWENTKTVQLWVKPTGTSPSCYMNDFAECDNIFGDRPRWWGIARGIAFGADRIWVWNMDGNFDYVGVTYTPGEWVNIALVHSAGLWRVYKNGALVSSVPSGATMQPNTGAKPVLHLGGVINGTNDNWTFEGEIDEVRLWNRELSATEVSQDLFHLLVGNETGLVAYYQMSDGPPSSLLTDDSQFNWTGTLMDGGTGVPGNGSLPLWVTSGAFDTPLPSVTINQATGQVDPTHNSPITFDVVFSESMTGFTGSDVSFTGSTAPGSLSASVSGSGATYTVFVSGMADSGTVVVSVPAGVAQNGSGIGNAASSSTDNTVSYDVTAPTVTINQAASQADPTNASPVDFDVVFSESVTGFTGSDVSFTGSTVSGTLSASVSGSGATYTISVTGMTGNGSVIASIPAGRASDLAGNSSVASTSTDNTVTYDVTAPTVTINQAASQADPTSDLPIAFEVVFSEVVTGFTGSDVDLSGSAAPGTLSATVSGSGTTYTVSITGMVASGTVIASIPLGAAQDAAGNGNSASTSTDNLVNYIAQYWQYLPGIFKMP